MRIFDPPTNEEQIEAAGRVSEIIIPNSAEKRRYPRAGTVYGVTFNMVTGEGGFKDQVQHGLMNYAV